MGFFDDLINAISGEAPVLGYFIIGADNEEYGPYSKEDIVGFLGEGRIGWSTMIRRGDDDWREIQHHPDFPSAPGPPPMPKKRSRAQSAPGSKARPKGKRAPGPPDPPNPEEVITGMESRLVEIERELESASQRQDVAQIALLGQEYQTTQVSLEQALNEWGR